MKNREKFYIATIIFLLLWVAYLTFFHKPEVKVIFSKPVDPVGNFTAPDRQDVWSQKL